LPTLKDVAKLAGVSVATASLALNGKPVSKKAKTAVLDCAKKLNYVPNKIGRTLSTGRSNTIQLLFINSKKYANLVKEISFFYHMIEGILNVMEEHDQSLHYDVKNWEDENLSRYFEQKVRDKTVDGIIIIPQYIRNYDFLPYLMKSGFPYVILSACFQDAKINTVRIDNYYGAKLAAELLLKNGYTKIGLINGPNDHYDAVERERGFLDTFHSSEVNVPQEACVNGDFTIASGYTAAEKLFNQYVPEALFCANDYMAAGAMQYIQAKGYEIPEDVAVIGYDNLDVAHAVYPRLTTLDNRVYDVGMKMMRTLFEIIDTGESGKEYILKPFIKIRGTCPSL